MAKVNSLEIGFDREMPFKQTWIIFLLAFLWSEQEFLFAQKGKVKFERISLEQGLSQNTVYCVLQDSKGFIWIGTQDGLNKYDGYTFTIFKNDPDDPYSLSNSVVRTIFEAGNGTLWIGTNGGGLNKLDQSSRERSNTQGPVFIHYKNDPDNPESLSDDYVLDICEGDSGDIWIGTINGGLNRFDPELEVFSRVQSDPSTPGSLTDNHVFALHIDQSGDLWLGGNGGLRMLDRDRQTFSNPPGLSNIVTDEGIRAIYEDRSGRLWIGAATGFHALDRESGSLSTYRFDPDNPNSLSDNSVWVMQEDRSGGLWIGTANGLNKLSHGANGGPPIFERYVHDPNDSGSLSDNYIRAIYEDRAGVLWIGTWSGGINKLDPAGDKFPIASHDPNDPGSLGHPNVRAFCEDPSGRLWIGTRGGGLNQFDRENGTFTHYKNIPDDFTSLSHNYVWSIYADRSGALWVGTYGGGLNRFNAPTQTFVRYQHDPQNRKSLSHKNVTPILEDRSGTLWIGTDGGGLNRYVPGTDGGSAPTFVHYRHDLASANSLSSNAIWSMYEDRSGRLWIGTSGGGLNMFDQQNETFSHFKHDPDNSNSLSNDYVFCIYQDQSGAFWIGTWGGGLNKLILNEGRQTDPDRDAVDFGPKWQPQFTHFREKDGLPNDVIYGIVEDSSGNLWLSSNKGLSRFDPKTESFKNYTAGDGLQSNEFNAGAFYKDRRGQLFFGGINGFNVFDPIQVTDNSHVPPIVITAVKKFGQVIRTDISTPADLGLSYKDKYLTFEFVALDYTNPRKNQYAFMMAGFDRDWNYSGTRRFASYTNLDPGKYVFKAKGSNNDAVWNEEGVSISITISPPPWKTWWAYTLYVTLTGALLFGLRRYETNRIRLKNQLKLEQMEAEKFKELNQLKSRFFANISHEFRTPLSLILGPIENAVSKTSNESIRGQLRMAFQNGRRLLRLINQLLDLSKLEAGRMELRANPVNLIPFLKGIVATFETLAEEKQISLEFRSNYTDLHVYCDAAKLEQVFYNLISNAIKFLPPDSAGRITVQVARTQVSLLKKLPPNIECVLITVKDTGIGIPSSRLQHIFKRFYQASEHVDNSTTHEQHGTGIGLALAKEIVELHYGQISVDSVEGKGTEFRLILPLGKDHLEPAQLRDERSPGEQKEDPEFREIAEAKLAIDPKEGILVAGKTEGTIEPDIVLVVEDNRELRTFIRQQLASKFKIIEADSGREGIDRAVEFIPDLIISDVMMPEMDGYELCGAVKTDERTSHIPLILLTAKAGEESKLEGLQSGADDYLTKPFSSKELIARVQNLIDQRRKLRERFRREVVLKPSEIAVTSMDEQFLNRVKEAIEKYIGDESFSVEDLAREAGVSRVQLHRKLKALTDQAASQFMMSIRLQRAVDLMKQNAGTVAEIAYMVGFNTPNYFAKCFRKQFGCSPSEYKMTTLSKKG